MKNILHINVTFDFSLYLPFNKLTTTSVTSDQLVDLPSSVFFCSQCTKAGFVLKEKNNVFHRKVEIPIKLLYSTDKTLVACQDRSMKV